VLEGTLAYISPALKLMQLLMSESDGGYLLLIGAYRDNEVFATHPLMLALEEIAKSKVAINTLTLAPLNQDSLSELIADTLICSVDTAKPLTKLVYQKTKGNPFFSTQFLKSLYEDELITFDFQARYWVCDIAQVKQLALTDDVVEFMAMQLQKLPVETQNLLKLAACIEDFIQDLLAHIECYQQHYPTPVPEVTTHAEEIDIEYISQDLPKLVGSMKVATERIKDISNSLRTFSRADTSEKIACNLHEGIESTLLILKYRLKANEKRSAIQIITDYGQLPLVKCFLGQLNQVFMNILANAIDALDTLTEEQTFLASQTNQPQIKITTKVSPDKNTVFIHITDNAAGMPEEIKQRIFDHLFTTKEIGKGTGLGLAIARQIVEETHAGKLTCNSTLGKGTEFMIEIPL
jgi:signal transduction histidine kinase